MILSFFRSFWYMIKSRSFTMISKDPYSTHLPVLIGLTSAYDVKKILEFGSGPNSTIAFTDKLAFPNTTQITSYENDHNWYEKIKELTVNDYRVKLIFFDGKIHDAVCLEKISSYDLIFVDDSILAKDRAKTISEVITHKPKILVIHDYENKAYRDATKPYDNLYWFKSLLPNTGIYLEKPDQDTLKKIDDIINNNKSKIENNDIEKWKKLFIKEFK